MEIHLFVLYWHIDTRLQAGRQGRVTCEWGCCLCVCQCLCLIATCSFPIAITSGDSLYSAVSSGVWASTALGLCSPDGFGRQPTHWPVHQWRGVRGLGVCLVLHSLLLRWPGLNKLEFKRNHSSLPLAPIPAHRNFLEVCYIRKWPLKGMFELKRHIFDASIV